MSVDENKRLVREYHEKVWSAGHLDLIGNYLADDFVDRTPNPGQPPGPEGVKGLMMMLHGAFPDVEFPVYEVFAEGDLVCTRWSLDGTNTGSFAGVPPSGKKCTMRGCDVSRVRNGKIVEIWHYDDVLGLMQQMGAIPS